MVVVAASFAGVFVHSPSTADLSFGRHRGTVGIVGPVAWIVQFSDATVRLNRTLLVQLATFKVAPSLEGLRREEQKASNETGCELHLDRDWSLRCRPGWEVGNLWAGKLFCEEVGCVLCFVTIPGISKRMGGRVTVNGIGRVLRLSPFMHVENWIAGFEFSWFHMHTKGKSPNACLLFAGPRTVNLGWLACIDVRLALHFRFPTRNAVTVDCTVMFCVLPITDRHICQSFIYNNTF